MQRVAVADPATRRSPELTPVAQVCGLPSAPTLTLHGLGPAYGCRFSDPAAYAGAGPVSQTDTRRLFDPCAGD